RPWHKNIGKRLVKSPKVYVRDSGITHALLGLGDKEEILGHPVVGPSWEGFVIENLLSVAPERADAGFYRASGGAEIDLVLTLPDQRVWAIEIKRSLDPKPARGFHSGCKDVKPDARFVVYPGDERFSISRNIEAINIDALAREIAAFSGTD
ncbi:MAG: DUF4143 domain-containing protein, partial [Xanthomonadales bacterium]